MDAEQREWFDEQVERTQAEWDFIAEQKREEAALKERQKMAALEPFIVR